MLIEVPDRLVDTVNALISIFNEGYEFSRRGATIQDCPFVDAHMRFAWLRGYRTYRMEQAKQQ